MSDYKPWGHVTADDSRVTDGEVEGVTIDGELSYHVVECHDVEGWAIVIKDEKERLPEDPIDKPVLRRVKGEIRIITK